MSDLADTAQAILTAAISALGSRAPARTFVAAGQVDYASCEQLTVTLGVEGLYGADPFPTRSTKPNRCAVVPTAVFLVECTRCVPTIQGTDWPSAESIQAAAEEILDDAETLWCSLVDAAGSGALFGPTRRWVFGAATPYGPSGAVGGVRIPITVQVDCMVPGS